MTHTQPTGVVCVNKHKGVTSHTIVNILRRLYNTKQVGHTGTLDPMATGVLPVMVGRAVKASEYLSSDTKAYTAHMKLGLVTDSGDITGNVISKYDTIPSFEKVNDAVKGFVGDIKQTPPMYSALKVNGQKLVNLARQGIEIEREARDIHISSIEVEKIEGTNDEYILNVKCSKGTYIRTLCTDIGERLGCGAVMTELNRTLSGDFSITSSYSVEHLENMSYEERLSVLCPVEALFSQLETVKLPAFFERLARSGVEIYIKKLGMDNTLPTGSRYKLYGKNGFFALGELREFEEGKAIKPIKQFDIENNASTEGGKEK